MKRRGVPQPPQGACPPHLSWHGTAQAPSLRRHHTAAGRGWTAQGWMLVGTRPGSPGVSGRSQRLESGERKREVSTGRAKPRPRGLCPENSHLVLSQHRQPFDFCDKHFHPKTRQRLIKVALTRLPFKIKMKKIKMPADGNSLAVQWLGLHASTAGGTGLIPRQGTKIPQATLCNQRSKKMSAKFEGITVPPSGILI